MSKAGIFAFIVIFYLTYGFLVGNYVTEKTGDIRDIISIMINGFSYDYGIPFFNIIINSTMVIILAYILLSEFGIGKILSLLVMR